MANELNGVDLDDLNYVHHYPYNGTGDSGGDPLTEDLNIWYEVCCFDSWSLVTVSATDDGASPLGMKF